MSGKYKPFLKQAGKSTPLQESAEKIYVVFTEEYKLNLKSYSIGGKDAVVRKIKDSFIDLKDIVLRLRISPFDLQQIHENSLKEMKHLYDIEEVADAILFEAVSTLYEIYREYIIEERGRMV